MPLRARGSLAGLVRCLAIASVPALAASSSAGLPDAPPPAGASADYRIAPGRSTVRFELDATGHTVHGASSQVSGAVQFDPNNLSREARVAFRVEAATLDTGNRTRDKKMRTSHLETDKFPRIEFESSKIEALAPSLREGESQELKVTGFLSLHGVKRSLSFPVKAARHGKELTVSGATTLKMTDYAIPLPKFLFFSVKDEVKVSFDVAAEPAGPGASP
jgi:polyisoprenoid-binding protein YceI